MLQLFTVAYIHDDKRNSDTYLSEFGVAAEEVVNLQVIPQFCFPLGADSQVGKAYLAAEEYSFTLTGAEGARLNGICRRFLPPRKSGLRYPQVMCIICEYPWFTLVFKVLEVLENLLMQQDMFYKYDQKELPHDSLAAQFLKSVNVQLSREPRPGQILRVPFPETDEPLLVLPCEKITYDQGPHADYEPLQCTEEFIELQIPPECGNGKFNGGISLARACWHIPIGGLLTLISSLLLERRVIMVSQFRGIMSAAVHAVSALIYPFQWQHIFIPVLPAALQDYLSAPMPFLIGMPAQLLPNLKKMGVQDVVVVDLDVSKVFPKTGSDQDDGMLLPRKKQLESALQAAISTLRNPSEFHANVIITGIMQEYFVRLFGSYRRFIRPTFKHMQGPIRLNDGNESEAIYGNDHWFDHDAFVSSHRRSRHAQDFMNLIRHSQLYEVFIQQRLCLAANEFRTDDEFEYKVAREQERLKSRTLSHLVGKNRAQSTNSLSSWVFGERKSTPGIFSNVSSFISGAVTDKHGHRKTVSMDSEIEEKHARQQNGQEMLQKWNPQIQEQTQVQKNVQEEPFIDPSTFFEEEEISEAQSEVLGSPQSQGFGFDVFNPFRWRANSDSDNFGHSGTEMQDMYVSSLTKSRLETIAGSAADVDPQLLAASQHLDNNFQLTQNQQKQRGMLSQVSIRPEIRQSIDEILNELNDGLQIANKNDENGNIIISSSNSNNTNNNNIVSDFDNNSTNANTVNQIGFPMFQQLGKIGSRQSYLFEDDQEKGSIAMKVIKPPGQKEQKQNGQEELFADLVRISKGQR